jgi:acetoacetyl-CoA reductase
VGDFNACGAAIGAVEAELGPVDVLVNDAGVTRDAPLRKMTGEQWDEVMRVDLDSMFNTCRQVVEGMCQRGFGRIINITSINGQKGQFGQTNYSAAKAGVIGFTKALAQETARKGVTVNAIAPGYIATGMLAAVPANVMEGIIADIPVGRLGRPEEVARCIAFLAAEDSGFITGATLSVNGGQYMV